MPVCRLLPTVLLLLLGLILGESQAAEDRVPELMGRLPRGTNAMFSVRIAEILETPRALEENWSQQQQERFLNGASSVPAWAHTLVVGSLVRPSGPRSEWSGALLSVPESTTLESLLPGEHVAIETLGNSRAIRADQDALYLEVSPGLLGVYTPAHRQDAVRWLEELATPNNGSGISPFLMNASKLPGHVVLAIDLQHMLDPERVRQRVAGAEFNSTAPELKTHLVEDLLSLQGATMSIVVGKENTATVTVSFKQPIRVTAPIMHQVFNSALSDAGLGIEELDKAATAVDGTAFSLYAKFSNESLRRVLSLMVPPAPHPVAPATAASPGTQPSPTTPSATAPRPVTPAELTRRYVTAVNTSIDDLRKANRNARDYSRTATWHDNFARRINNLPTRGVDKDVLDYGVSVSDKFRGLAASLRGQKVQVIASQNALQLSYSIEPWQVGVNWWGEVGYRPPMVNVDGNFQEVRQKQMAAVEAGAADRDAIWTSIDNARAAIETTLRSRYGDDFLSSRP